MTVADFSFSLRILEWRPSSRAAAPRRGLDWNYTRLEIVPLAKVDCSYCEAPETETWIGDCICVYVA